MTQPCDICGAASVMTDGICNAYLCDRSECLDAAWGRAFGSHHPDCPVNHWPDMPQRCRCMFMAMLDKPNTPTGKDGAA